MAIPLVFDPTRLDERSRVTIGRRVAAGRRALNFAGDARLADELPMSIERLAVLAAVPVGVVEALEQGRVAPAPLLRIRIARALGLSERLLFAVEAAA